MHSVYRDGSGLEERRGAHGDQVQKQSRVMHEQFRIRRAGRCAESFISNRDQSIGNFGEYEQV